MGLNPPSPVSSPRESNPKATPTSGQKSLAIPLPAPSPTSTLQRRWSQTQAKDFHDLHTTLATMILNCDLNAQNSSTKGPDESGILPIPPEVTSVLYGQSSLYYLQVPNFLQQFPYKLSKYFYFFQELVVACCHLNNISSASSLIRMLLYVARERLDFSRALLRETLVLPI